MVLLSLLLRLFRGRLGGVAFGLALLAVFGCLCSPSVPQPDSCTAPSTTGVDTIELGPGADGPFRPFNAGEKLTTVRGGQGAGMLTFRLRVGPKAPGCIGETVRVNSAFDHTSLASLEVPASTYDDPGGKRVTRTMYLIGTGFGAGFPSRVQVVATVGQTTTQQTFAVDGPNACGAIVTCEQSCNFECDQCAAGASAEAIAARDQVTACVATACGSDPDAGRTDSGSVCRYYSLQDQASCKTTWDTCQSTR